MRLELDSARERLKITMKYREEADLKSKSDFKLLVKEVKSLRSSQSELKQEHDRVSKERGELEVIFLFSYVFEFMRETNGNFNKYSNVALKELLDSQKRYVAVRKHCELFAS